eukprot:gene5497-3968_t
MFVSQNEVSDDGPRLGMEFCNRRPSEFSKGKYFEGILRCRGIVVVVVFFFFDTKVQHASIKKRTTRAAQHPITLSSNECGHFCTVSA